MNGLSEQRWRVEVEYLMRDLSDRISSEVARMLLASFEVARPDMATIRVSPLIEHDGREGVIFDAVVLATTAGGAADAVRDAADSAARQHDLTTRIGEPVGFRLERIVG